RGKSIAGGGSQRNSTSHGGSSVPLNDLDADLLAKKIAAKLVEHLRSDQLRLLDRSQMAERLGISERGLSGLASRGQLPAGYLIGGARRWDWTEVLRFLGARKDRKPRRGRGRYDRRKEGGAAAT